MTDIERLLWQLGQNVLVNHPHEFEDMWIVRTPSSFGQGMTLLEALEDASE